MTIALTGTNGLFTRVGRCGKLLKLANVYAGTTVPPDLTTLLAQYTPANVDDLPVGMPAAVAAVQSAVDSLSQAAGSLASDTVNRMVYLDNPQLTNTDIGSSLGVLIAQMKAATASVQKCTVTATSAANAGNNGTGFVVLTTLRGDALVQENLFAEIATLTCSSDAQTGGQVAGSEQFTFLGTVPETSPLAFDWPLGSAATAALTAIDATTTGLNLLTNSDFETFTVANTPDGWTIETGVAGTDVLHSTGQHYTGTSSLEYVGGATLTDVSQPLTLAPYSIYAVNLLLKVDVVPAAGVLTVELTDGSGTQILNAQGAANAFTVTLSALTTSWASHPGVFTLPRVLPPAIKLRLRLSTALSGGSNLFLDHVAFGQMTTLYAGGPSCAIFSGVTPYIAGDGYSVTTTNDRGGASNNATFQTLFDRLFNMRQLQLLLPSSASPTVADTLITT